LSDALIPKLYEPTPSTLPALPPKLRVFVPMTLVQVRRLPVTFVFVRTSPAILPLGPAPPNRYENEPCVSAWNKTVTWVGSTSVTVTLA